MSRMDTERLEELLDWLAGEMAARLSTSARPLAVAKPDDPRRRASESPQPERGKLSESESAPESSEAQARPATAESESSAFSATLAESQSSATSNEEPAAEPLPVVAAPDVSGPPAHASPLPGRLAVALLVAVLLINIPLNANGTALARMIPSSVSVVVRNGLLVKETDTPDVYVYQNGQFRWVADLEAFQHYGYKWQNVQDVAPGFLAGYDIGRPIYLLAKCADSPHIYQLANGFKRWIVDIPTFEAQGYQWSDVQIMGCADLSRMPMGETIPPGRGPAPQP